MTIPSLPRLGLACLLGAWLGYAAPAGAVVAHSDEVPFQNTTPSGLSAGEQQIPEWLGELDGFLVTAVGPRFVLAARHIFVAGDDGVGAQVEFDSGPNAGTYTVISSIDDPSADLRLLELDAALATWAPLYPSADEQGQTATIFGRGAAAGAAVILPINPILEPLKGWEWGTGPASDPWSWGRNVVSATLLDPTRGPVLEIEFDRGSVSAPALPNECHLSNKDSSGPWFLLAPGGGYELAAVSTAVLGPFRTELNGTPFDAMILDYGGLYLPGATEPFPDLAGAGNDFPSNATAVRISQRLAWLDPLLALGDPDGDGVLLDNCSARANPSQLDTDDDGYGNACDCDFDQLGTCNIGDFIIFFADFGLADSGVGTDMDGNGVVNNKDLNSFFLPLFVVGDPGPSVFVP